LNLSFLPGTLLKRKTYPLSNGDKPQLPGGHGSIDVEMYCGHNPKQEAFNLRVVAAANVIGRPVYLAGSTLMSESMIAVAGTAFAE
jgi:hypothetical protein